MIFLKLSKQIIGRPKPFCFQLHWFEEKTLMGCLEQWWNEMSFVGNPNFVLHKRLQGLRIKIKEWVRSNMSEVEENFFRLEFMLKGLELEEED